jgi:putative hydrolase of the HAD superfamily
MMNKLPTSVVLDLDDTLYEYLPCHKAGLSAVFQLMSQKLNITENEAENIYESGRNIIKDRLGPTASSHSRLLYFREGMISKGLGSQATLCFDFENSYWNFFMFEMKIREGARNFLSRLRSENIPIYLVTDLTDQIQLKKIIKLNLETSFTEIISSELAGGDKITKKPFEFLFRLLSPEILGRPIFIGDSIQDFPHPHLLNNSAIKYFSFSKNINVDFDFNKVINFHDIESLIFS